MKSLLIFAAVLVTLFSVASLAQTAVIRSGNTSQTMTVYRNSADAGTGNSPNGLACFGSDGTNVRVLLTNSSGALTTTSSGTSTVAGAKTNDDAAPGATNVGALTCVANAAAPSWTEGNLVGCSVDLAGNQRVNVAQMNGVATSMGNGVSGTGVQRVTVASDSTGTSVCTQSTAASLKSEVVGTKTTNAAAPGATNVGALGAVANAAAPSHTEGYLVAASVDLSGAQRSSLSTRIAGENLAGVVGDVSDWSEVRLDGRTVYTPTATTTEVAATACATPSAAGCTVIYASTDVLIWKDITVTIRNSDASDALTQVIVEWSPTGNAGTWEKWDDSTFAALGTSTTKSLAISGNSRRFLRIEAGAAAVVTSAVVNITAAQ